MSKTVLCRFQTEGSGGGQVSLEDGGRLSVCWDAMPPFDHHGGGSSKLDAVGGLAESGEEARGSV